MPREALNVHIDLVALQADFFRHLQRQFDVIKILQVGCDVVTAEQIANAQEFGAFAPENGAQLPHEQAKSEAHDWLLSGFLRDAIEEANKWGQTPFIRAHTARFAPGLRPFGVSLNSNTLGVGVCPAAL